MMFPCFPLFRFLGFAFPVVIWMATADSTIDKIPLGIIFEKQTEEIQQAFKFAMLNHNRDLNKKFELLGSVDIINTADVFKLTGLICTRFSNGVASMLGAVSSNAFDTLYSYSNTFHVPFVTPWFPEKVLNASSDDYAISLWPDYHKAIIDMVIHYGWDKVIYVYDSHDGLIRLQQIDESLIGRQNFHVEAVKRIVNETDAIEFLLRVEAMNMWGNKYVILDCPAELAKKIIISHVRHERLGRRTYHYLLSGLIMDDEWETTIPYGVVNITGFKIVDKNRKFVKDFLELRKRRFPNLAGSEDTISAQFALMYDAVFVLVEAFNKLLKKKPEVGETLRRGPLFNNGSRLDCYANYSNNTWVTPWEHGDKISKHLRKVEMEGLTGEVRFNDHGRRRNFTLQVVKMSLNNVLEIIGNWSDVGGLSLESHPNHVYVVCYKDHKTTIRINKFNKKTPKNNK